MTQYSLCRACLMSVTAHIQPTLSNTLVAALMLHNFSAISDLLEGVLKQSLSGHRDLYMAGQGIGLDRDQIKRRRKIGLS